MAHATSSGCVRFVTTWTDRWDGCLQDRRQEDADLQQHRAGITFPSICFEKFSQSLPLLRLRRLQV